MASKAIEFDPDNSFARQWRGWVYIRMNALDKALEDYNQCLHRRPSDCSLYVERAFLHLRRQQPFSAIQDLEEALRLESDNHIALWCRFEARRHYYGPGAGGASAREDIDRAIDLSPMNAIYRLTRATVSLENEELDKAYEDVMVAINIMPSNHIALRLRSRIRSRKQEVSEAIVDMNAAVALDPSDFDSYIHRARLMIEQGSLALSLQDLRIANSLKPGRYAGSVCLSIAHGLNGDFCDALENIGKCIEMQPDNTNLLKCRSRFFIQSLQYQRAIEDLERAIALQPRDPIIYFLRGWALCLMAKEEDRCQFKSSRKIHLSQSIANFRHALLLKPNMKVALLAKRKCESDLISIDRKSIKGNESFTHWSVSDVTCWLRNLHLSSLIPIFRRLGINGTLLDLLKHDDLEQMGVPFSFQRNLIIDTVTELRRDIDRKRARVYGAYRLQQCTRMPPIVRKQTSN